MNPVSESLENPEACCTLMIITGFKLVAWSGLSNILSLWTSLSSELISCDAAGSAVQLILRKETGRV